MGFRRQVTKKGDMSFSMLIKIILGLVVLGIMSYIFWNQVIKSNNNIGSIEDNGKNTITDGMCEYPGLGNKCVLDSCPQGYAPGEGKCDVGTCCKKTT